MLSVYVARSAGVWVLAIGAARYAFLAAGYLLPWMRAPLPPRYWRKVVTATQGIVLTVAAAGILSPTVSKGALVVALVLLAESFGRDVRWLRRNRRLAISAGNSWRRPHLGASGSYLQSGRRRCAMHAAAWRQRSAPLSSSGRPWWLRTNRGRSRR